MRDERESLFAALAPEVQKGLVIARKLVVQERISTLMIVDGMPQARQDEYLSAHDRALASLDAIGVPKDAS